MAMNDKRGYRSGLVDLRLGGGQGSAILEPREHTVWPVRIAFRVLPGQFGALEVRAAQRVVLPITTTGTKPVDLELAPGVFIMKSPQMAVPSLKGASACLRPITISVKPLFWR